MALRQRQWVIYTRPFYNDTQTNSKLFYTQIPKAAPSDFGKIGSYPLTLSIFTVSGGVTLANSVLDAGSWVVSFRSYSITEVKNAYKELLKTFPADYIRITEEIPFDTMITPIS